MISQCFWGNQGSISPPRPQTEGMRAPVQPHRFLQILEASAKSVEDPVPWDLMRVQESVPDPKQNEPAKEVHGLFFHFSDIEQLDRTSIAYKFKSRLPISFSMCTLTFSIAKGVR